VEQNKLNFKSIKTIYSSDVDLEQANFIVMNDGRCLWVEHYEDNEDKVIVFFFDLLTEVENWIDLKDINDTCDTNYSIDKEINFTMLTQDVCYYYGAINLDGMPSEYTNEEFNELINTI
jgi:hypothetical protein